MEKKALKPVNRKTANDHESMSAKTSPASDDSHPAYGKISDEQFGFLTQYLSGKYGLRIPREKKILLESRLIKRLSALKLNSIEAYIDYIFKAEHAGAEYQMFVDHITTHKTFFFRENHQFEFLKSILPGYHKRAGYSRQVNVWSAGCSTGEEVYTLGIVLNEQKNDIPGLEYRVIGTDVSVPSLKSAAKGVFSTELENIPAPIREKYFTRVEGHRATTLRFTCPEVTSRINLGVLNLNNRKYNLPCSFDFVFCRNVIIYFDAKTRNEVLERIVEKLKPGGYLFLGHSETALGTTLPLKSIQPTIYQKL
jgi:chemotaxis protein methyltransferase CheR